MKCDFCKRKYRGQNGYTVKDMNKNKIIIHACSLLCLSNQIIKVIPE